MNTARFLLLLTGICFAAISTPSAASEKPRVAVLGFELINIDARAGADLAAWGTVRKVSNLILSINVYLIDARTGERVFARSVDIRGNTDDSWRHGLRYLVRNYLLAEP